MITCSECPRRKEIHTDKEKLQDTKTGWIELQGAIDTLNEVIPPPNNHMVDAAHKEIAYAWEKIKTALFARKGETGVQHERE